MTAPLTPPPPNCPDMEIAALGAMLINRDDALAAVERLRPLDFYKGAHRAVFIAAGAVLERDQCLDVPLLAAELKATGRMEEAGGAAYLGEIVAAAPQGSPIEPYLSAIREASHKRALISAATEMLRGAQDGRTASDVAGAFSAELAKVEERLAGGMDNTDISSVMDDIFRELDAEKPHGLTTGLVSFDKRAGGFMPGNLILVAARPGVGKTTLALQWMKDWGLRGIPSYVASYEMEKIELGQKCASALSGVPLWKNGQPKEREGEYLNACLQVKKLHIYIEAPTDRSLLRLRLTARKHARLDRKPAQAVFVDYIQQVRGESSDTREQEVASVSRGLKALARELKVPVIACCQLNRAIAPGQEPGLNNLRESGALEQDADTVIFIHDPNPTDEAPVHRVKVKVAKNRRGPTGSCFLDFNREIGTFSDCTDQTTLLVGNSPRAEGHWND